MAHAVPSYRHHKATGRAVVTLSGRDIYLGEWNTPESRSAYDRVVAEWMVSGRQLPHTSGPGTLLISELLVSYLAFAQEYYSCRGEPGREYVGMKGAIRPLEELYAGTRVADFGPRALKAVRLRMINAGLCRTEINRRINRIRRVFKWGVEDELVPANVLHALQAVAPLKRGRTTAPESEPVLPVPDADVDAVLPHVSRQVAAMIQLQRLTGMRPGEVVLLRPCDVDRTSSVWIYTLTEHKTAYHGHRRDVYLGPQAQALLIPWMERDGQAYCFSPAEAEAERNALRRQNRETPMTPSQARRRPKRKPKRAKRERYDVDSYHGAIDYGIKKAGVAHWHPHQLRHTCATRVRREYGLDAAQVILGHRSVSVTQVYAEVDRAKAFAVAGRIG